jgi:hypothetical protein
VSGDDAPQHDAQHVLANSMAYVALLMAPIREATIGYRKSLIDMGMGAEAADRCAVDYHAWLMQMVPTRGTK